MSSKTLKRSWWQRYRVGKIGEVERFERFAEEEGFERVVEICGKAILRDWAGERLCKREQKTGTIYRARTKEMRDQDLIWLEAGSQVTAALRKKDSLAMGQARAALWPKRVSSVTCWGLRPPWKNLHG